MNPNLKAGLLAAHVVILFCVTPTARAGASVILDDLAAAPKAGLIKYVAMSPDCRHIAIVARSEKGVALLIDGKPAADADDISSVLYSPDGAHLIYAARKGKIWSVVLDGNEVEAGAATPEQAAFNNDGTHVIYVLSDVDGARLVVDGRPQTRYRLIKNVTISPKGFHVAYAAVDAMHRWVAIRDNQESGRTYQVDIDRFTFSPDGEHLMYIGCNSKDPLVYYRYVMERDGVAWGPFVDVTGGPAFTPDSRHWYVLARRALSGPHVVKHPNAGDTIELSDMDFELFDGQLERVNVGISQMLYSGDGVHQMSLENRWAGGDMGWPARHYRILHLDGAGPLNNRPLGNEEFGMTQDHFDVTLSPDGNHVASVNRPSDGGSSSIVMIDASIGRPWKDVGPPLFSPDSKHVAYAVENGTAGEWSMCIDDSLQPGSLVVSTIDLVDGSWDPTTEFADQRGIDNGHAYAGAYPYHFDSDGALVYFQITDGHLYRVHWKPDGPGFIAAATTLPATKP